jgi:hypothetical protein
MGIFKAVSYVDGKKWHKSKKEIEKLEAQIRERRKKFCGADTSLL